MIHLKGIHEIVDRYDLYLLDQFGVLHDGAKAYPGSIATLEGIQVAGKQAVVVSNSGRSGEFNRARMRRMGFPDDLLPPVVTSGDCLRPWLEQNLPVLRLRIYVSGDLDESLPRCERVADVREADLMIFNSFSHAAVPDEKAIGLLLEVALGRRIPMVCTNPDEIALKGDTSFRAPGSFAREYQRQGGSVTFIGKPFPLIFENTFAMFPAIPRKRTIYVGDSLDHDVRGAKMAGVSCLWILKGVHREYFAGLDLGTRQASARTLADKDGLQPEFTMDELAW